MATLRDIKNRIGSVQSTRQITRTMEMVATAKLKKAQTRIENARPYALAIAEVHAGRKRSKLGAGAAARGARDTMTAQMTSPTIAAPSNAASQRSGRAACCPHASSRGSAGRERRSLNQKSVATASPPADSTCGNTCRRKSRCWPLSAVRPARC